MASKNPNEDLRGVLHALSSTTPGEVIKLRRDATIFGREKGDIIVNDHEISSTHCQIQNINGSYHLFDMNSTNGTFVNNERVVKSKLNPGDTITIGQTSFRFELEQESRVRHISTIFKGRDQRGMTDTKVSLVDTLIEGELKGVQTGSIVLNVTYGDGSKDEIELNQRSFFIGRASSFAKFDQDPEMSRKHLLVKVNDSGEIFIEDQGSTNGSFLNGKRLQGMHIVRPTDEVRVGSVLIRCRAKTT
ncbi:MAG: FHA domain-containing protein [Deltaproteobacteria bacterium]|nr:FHA domain-containing protein [Deltaproteobacteria bacterium]